MTRMERACKCCMRYRHRGMLNPCMHVMEVITSTASVLAVLMARKPSQCSRHACIRRPPCVTISFMFACMHDYTPWGCPLVPWSCVGNTGGTHSSGSPGLWHGQINNMGPSVPWYSCVIHVEACLWTVDVDVVISSCA